MLPLFRCPSQEFPSVCPYCTVHPETETELPTVHGRISSLPFLNDSSLIQLRHWDSRSMFKSDIFSSKKKTYLVLPPYLSRGNVPVVQLLAGVTFFVEVFLIFSPFVCIMGQNWNIVTFSVTSTSFLSELSGHGGRRWGSSSSYHASRRDPWPLPSCVVNTQ